MSDDPFDPKKYRLDRRFFSHREAAKFDRDISLFRRIWEAVHPEDRDRLKSDLYALDALFWRITRATGNRVGPSNLATIPEAAAENLAADLDAVASLDREIAKQKHPAYITPGEYLCAIACWEAGEDYVCDEPYPQTHPRWPFAEERRMMLRLLGR